MSILKPKDGDYITRGVFLLLGWFCIGWLPFAYLGGVTFALLFGPTTGVGGATIFLFAYVPLGVWLYWLYLQWSSKNI